MVRRHSRSRSSSLLLVCALASAFAPLHAQFLGMGDETGLPPPAEVQAVVPVVEANPGEPLPQGPAQPVAGEAPRPEQPAPVEPEAPPVRATVWEPARRPFVMGQDNIGFANPGGAVQIAGMSGNCYTMAVVAKLFYQAARYQAQLGQGETRGFDRRELAAALRARDFPATAFPVRGYASLFELSDARSLSGPEAFMDQASRHRTGLRADPPDETAPANADSLVELYRVITTIHYLHYIQNQAQSLVGSLLRHARVGADAVPRVQAATIARLKETLPTGELGVLCMFNPDPKVVFGHVVLAYKVVEEEGAPHTDIYVYEDNQVYDRNTPETILRVERATGKFEYWEKSPRGVPQRQGNGNPGYSFWNPDTMNLLLMPDSNADPAQREELARKLEASDEATAYVQASGDLIGNLTRRPPPGWYRGQGQVPPVRDEPAQGGNPERLTESSLGNDIRTFVLALQRSNRHLGVRPPFLRGEPLPEDATTAQLNTYLEANTDAVVRNLFPYVLPEGLSLSDTRLRVDETDPNRASLWTTLVIEQRTPIDRILREVESSFLFARDPKVAALVRGASGVFAGEKITLKLRFSLVKGETPAALREKVGRFAPVPNLDGSHAIIGDLQAGTYDPAESDHRIEIAERILARSLTAALRSQGAFTKQSFSYSVGFADHTSDFTLRSAGLDTQTRSLVLTAGFGGFLGFNPFWDDYGSGYSSREPMQARLNVTKATGKNVFRVSASASGQVSFSDGVTSFLIDKAIEAVNLVLGLFLPQIQTAASGFVSAQLGRFVTFANGTSLTFGRPGVTSRGGVVSLWLPINAFDIDVGATITTLFGSRAPMEVKDIRFTTDRLVLLTSNDG